MDTNDINVGTEVETSYLGETVVGKVTHIRDVDDAPNKYRLLRISDDEALHDWFLGWFTADQLSPVKNEEAEYSEDAELNVIRSEDPEREVKGDA